MGEITQLLEKVQVGQPGAQEQLYSRLYGELQDLARAKLGPDFSRMQLDAAGLVHEAYLRLAQQQRLPASSRQAFFAYAARVMRSVIVDQARERQASKRGSGVAEITLVTAHGEAPVHSPDVLALDLALNDLKKVDERCLHVVELKFFAGFSLDEIAQALEISPATVKRDWQKARAFLYRHIKE